MGFILDRIGLPACYEQLAEECAELAQAALKMARLIRGENPTPVTHSEAMEHLHEEVVDVLVVMRELDLIDDAELKEEDVERSVRKVERWYRRLGEAEKAEETSQSGQDAPPTPEKTAI